MLFAIVRCKQDQGCHCRWIEGYSLHRRDPGGTAISGITLSRWMMSILTLSLQEREKNQTIDVVTRQLNAVAASVSPADWDKIVIAYEPVWYISLSNSTISKNTQKTRSLTGIPIHLLTMAILLAGRSEPAKSPPPNKHRKSTLPSANGSPMPSHKPLPTQSASSTVAACRKRTAASSPRSLTLTDSLLAAPA